MRKWPLMWASFVTMSMVVYIVEIAIGIRIIAPVLYTWCAVCISTSWVHIYWRWTENQPWPYDLLAEYAIHDAAHCKTFYRGGAPCLRHWANPHGH